MADKSDLQEWVIDGLKANGGEVHLSKVAKYIWDNHEADLRASGDLFYTWQYDMRWAAQNLQKVGKLKKLSKTWRLT
ncbi:hypothetical protein [Yoonia sp. MH D7]